MEKEFIPYEEALALKELGFDEPCLGRFVKGLNALITDPWNDEFCKKQTKNTILCPLYQQAFRWFREKHNIEQSISRMPPEMQNRGGKIKKYSMFLWSEELNPRGYQEFYDTYEEAELISIKRMIEIVKNKNS